jgi:hypothetical protein
MAHKFNEQVDVLDDDANATISLVANRGAVYAGDHGKSGSLRLKDDDGNERVIIDATGRINVRSATGGDVLGVDGEACTVELGGDAGRATVRLDGSSGTLTLGAEGSGGNLKVIDGEGGLMFQVTASLARLRGGLVVGAKEAKGSIGIMGPMGRPAIHADGGTAKLQLGNIGNPGDLAVLDNEAEPVLEFDGLTATLTLGGSDKPGYLVLRDREGHVVGRLSGNEAGLFLGREDKAGEILILDDSGQSSFSVDGANGVVSAGKGDNRVIIDGSAGDIKLSGADCAERFPLRDAASVEPGTVLVMGDDAALGACQAAYAKRVAGVASGARGVRPGIVLNRDEGGNGEPPVALNGKVFCKVDAGFGAVDVGDLLTTSTTPGHAMKAADARRAHGAVLGKAMAKLDAGTGLIPVLVSLL